MYRNIPFQLMCVIMAFINTSNADLDLTLLHINDFHARYEQTDKYSGTCNYKSETEGKCFGGTARLASKVQEIRDKENHSNILFLSAGDEYQGTLWFYKYGGSLAARYMNKLGYDAMALGNHEFDRSIDGLFPFLDMVTFPVLSQNLDITNEPRLRNKVKGWVKYQIGGDIIGIIGYTTSKTGSISDPGPTVKFQSEIQSIRLAVKQLKNDGVNKIIAVGHAGLQKDLQIARSIEDIDIVIGGHTNTFLYTGSAPSIEKPEGEYPLVITHKSGATTLVVQDYAFAKYLGHLKVTFDDDGNIVTYSGNPVLLDSSVEEDEDILEDMRYFKEGVENLTKEVIGKTHVRLEARKEECRLKECNFGNLITDAMVKQNIRHSDSMYWNNVSIAVVNSGGIRSSIEAGYITVGQVLGVQPFRNTIDIIEIKGRDFVKILEHSVGNYDPQEKDGRFLQMAGVRVIYDVSQPVGSRVINVKVACTRCDYPKYVPLNSTEVYRIIIPQYLATGGDDYIMIPKDTIARHIIGDLDTDVLMEYIKQYSPITHGEEERIMFVNQGTYVCMSAAAGTVSIEYLAYALFYSISLSHMFHLV